MKKQLIDETIDIKPEDVIINEKVEKINKELGLLLQSVWKVKIQPKPKIKNYKVYLDNRRTKIICSECNKKYKFNKITGAYDKNTGEHKIICKKCYNNYFSLWDELKDMEFIFQNELINEEKI